ncbi:MAG: hypothetical protein J3Q66DRAFT_321160 [Benniella sp.]|nr:MAG: hypothetical protein J3Q66DRAFT_321160 [Benniella sp.]
MSDALDDWEQADEDDIQAPVVAATSKSTKKTVVTPVGLTIASGKAPIVILQRNHEPKSGLNRGGSGSHEDDHDDLSGPGTSDPKDSRSLHERNRMLWEKANAYEQPVISRSDNTNQRTEFVPEIKILRRPKSPVQSAVKTNHIVPKSFAQREAAYMAAREKIFGPSSSTTSTTSTPTSTTTGNSSAPATPASSIRPSPAPRSSSSPSTGPGLHGEPSSGGRSMSSEDGIRPIEFRGVPPSIRPTQRPQSGGGQGYTVIRQPQGPSNVPGASSPMMTSPQPGGNGTGGGGGGRGAGGAGGVPQDNGGSIGFRTGFRPRPPPPSTQRTT